MALRETLVKEIVNFQLKLVKFTRSHPIF